MAGTQSTLSPLGDRDAEERAVALEEFQRAFGEFGGVERRYAHVGGLETRDNGDPDSLFSVNGSAIVFNRFSLDLGGFKEEIAPEAVREALAAEDADFHLLWDHDTTLVLARNRNGTLNTEIGEESVNFWGRVAKTSYAADLRVLMDRGDVDECSFAFTIAPGGEEWRMQDDGSIVRRVTKIERLWDLTICARGAYPQTHSATVRSAVEAMAQERSGFAARLEHAQEVLDREYEERALQPGLVAWQDERGYGDIACDLEYELDAREGDSWDVFWWVVDINVRDGGSEAIVCRYEFGAGCDYFLVNGIIYDSNDEPVLPDLATFQAVAVKWVAVQTEVVEEEGDEVVIVLDSAPEVSERHARKLREADLKVAEHKRAEADELEERHAEPGTAEVALSPEDSAEEPAEDEDPEAPAADSEDAAEEPAEGSESTDEPEDAEEAPAEAEEDAEDTAEEPDASEDEERKRKAALARARGRAALA